MSLYRENGYQFLCISGHEERFADTEELDHVWALEIYNHGCTLDGGLQLDTRDWDAILETGRQIYGVATDDNHNLSENSLSMESTL